MSLTEPPGPDDPTLALERRARTHRRARIAVLALVVGYFFLPYEWQAWIPVWLPFLLALGLELQFFVGGHMQARRGTPPVERDAGPQPRDLAELGGPHWRETYSIAHGLVPTGDLESDEDVEERLAAYVEDPEATLEEVEEAAPRPAQPSYRRYVVEAVIAIALVAGILVYAARPHGWSAVSDANRARAEAIFSKQAARIAGHEAVVRCDTGGRFVGFVQEADGLAQVGGTRAYLTPSICNSLYQLAIKDRVQSFPATARAIAVLAHEAWHLRGVSDEGLANCYGFQSGVQLGVALGLSEGRARAMMREQLAANASVAATSPEYLVPPTCRNGGADDLHPAVRAFP